jgi:hypothetical protein
MVADGNTVLAVPRGDAVRADLAISNSYFHRSGCRERAPRRCYYVIEELAIPEGSPR